MTHFVQAFNTVFHQQMKDLEDCQKYSAGHPIFNSLLSVSSGDEALRLMLDILCPLLSLSPPSTDTINILLTWRVQELSEGKTRL